MREKTTFEHDLLGLVDRAVELLTDDRRIIESEITDEILAELDATEMIWRDTVQVGDFVDASNDQTFLSGPRFITKGKLYTVKRLDFRPEQKSYTVVVDSDVPGEIAWLGHGNLIIRDGVVVWNWHTCVIKVDSRESYHDYLLRAEAELKGLRNGR